MDRLDIRILRELFQAHTVWPARPGPVASYRRVARAVRASPGTVRNRLREMVRTGFLRGIAVYPNPYAIGRRSHSYAVEVAPDVDKEAAVRAVLRVPEVVMLENFHGRLIGVGIANRDDASLARCVAEINRIVHAPGGLVSGVEHPPVAGPIAPAEWALIERLMQGDFPSYGHLAADLGTSTRTLKRRLARLAESNAIMTYPRLDHRSLAGGATADLLVQFVDAGTRGSTEPRIRSLVEPWVTYVGAWEEFMIYRLVLPNIAMATDLAAAVQRLDGVRAARAEFAVEFLDRLDEFRREVHARSGTASRAVGPPSRKDGRRSRRPSGVRRAAPRSRAARSRAGPRASRR